MAIANELYGRIFYDKDEMHDILIACNYTTPDKGFNAKLHKDRIDTLYYTVDEFVSFVNLDKLYGLRDSLNNFDGKVEAVYVHLYEPVLYTYSGHPTFDEQPPVFAVKCKTALRFKPEIGEAHINYSENDVFFMIIPVTISADRINVYRRFIDFGTSPSNVVILNSALTGKEPPIVKYGKLNPFDFSPVISNGELL